MLKIFGIRNCDTMKKAMHFLEAQGLAYEFVDYRQAGVAAKHLPDWCARGDWQTLLNKRGLTWKKLSDAERDNLDAAKAMQLMAEYPTLIKRPVLDAGQRLLVGFSAQTYQQLADTCA